MKEATRKPYPNGETEFRRMTIKELPPDERPRERLIEKGPGALTEAELLAIIIRDGTRKESALDIARRLLAEAGSLRQIAAMSVPELRKIRGIGPARAAQVKAALELAARIDGTILKRGERFTSSRAVFEHFHPRIRDAKQECFYVVLLDVKNRIQKVVNVSTGGLSVAIVNPRDVLKHAVAESASAVIVVHNHPSGDPEPSPDDIHVTRRIKEACDLTGIRFLDHVIVGEEGYVSLADLGKV